MATDAIRKKMRIADRTLLAKVGATPAAELEQFLPDVWKREGSAEQVDAVIP